MFKQAMVYLLLIKKNNNGCVYWSSNLASPITPLTKTVVSRKTIPNQTAAAPIIKNHKSEEFSSS